MKTSPRFSLPAIFISWSLAAGAAHALDGGNSVFVTVPTGTTLGWQTFEIISGNDTLGAIAKEGFVWTSKHDDWDGLGAYKHDGSTLRVFINHEAGSNSTFSRVDLNLANLETWIANGIPNNNNTNQVAAPGQIVEAVSRGWLTVGSGTNPINNPCSGNVWPADTFGPGRGFADQLYLTTEETFDTSGHFWVMDVANREIHEAVDLGGGSWENGTIIDTGRTDTVAVLLSEDAGSSATGTASQNVTHGSDGSAVTATPDSGYGFVDWGDGVLTATRTDLDLESDLSVMANFVVTDHYLVWVSAYPSLAGPDAATTGDPDSDLVPNAHEYAFNLDPTVRDHAVVMAGTGMAGLPLVEVRNFGAADRLVIEYLRRLDGTGLSYTPQFGSDLSAPGWGPGATETITPINSSFERVVVEDAVNISAASKRFGRVEIQLLSGP